MLRNVRFCEPGEVLRQVRDAAQGLGDSVVCAFLPDP